MKMKTALVIGYTGQDGSYATELLKANGYRVVGTSRAPPKQVPAVPDGCVTWDLLDADEIGRLVAEYRPDEIYNFSAYSSGSGMFDDPVDMARVNGLAVTMILEAIRAAGGATRFCQASSSEMFGEAFESPQTEDTPFCPRSPYGAAKLYAHNMIGIYRNTHGVFGCSAILFNHESPRRGICFVTRKIVREAVRIKMGLADKLHLGNLEARRDWGYAPDCVLAMWLMLQQDAAADYVIATGQTHSVRELCELAFANLGLDYRNYLSEDPDAYRAPEVVQLVGNAAKARRQLGWSPGMSFETMIKIMTDAEVAQYGN